MARVNLVDPVTAGATRPALDEIKSAFGVVPNMFKAVAKGRDGLKREGADDEAKEPIIHGEDDCEDHGIPH